MTHPRLLCAALACTVAIASACGTSSGDPSTTPNHDPRRDASTEPTSGSDGGSSGPPTLPWSDAPTKADPSWLDKAPACDRDDWTKKYYVYRQRFVGDGTAQNPGFISIGEGPGESLPATMRDPDADCAGDWHVSGCTNLSPPKTKGLYAWGDTTIWLGWHIFNLSTELAALTQAGMPTAKTKSDLQHALASFNRLDRTAEVSLGYPPALDGFFLRDDVGGSLVYRDQSAGILRFPRSDGGLLGYGCIGSSGACLPQTVDGGDFVSQDQVIGLLLGLAFVEKLVPPGTVVEGMDLRREGQAITHRMVSHLRSHSWKVTAPDGSHPPDEWGGNALAFSDQFARAANRLVGTTFGVSDYADALSKTAGTAGMIGADASWALQNPTNRSLAIKLAIINNVWDQDKLATRATSIQAPAFAMMHALLWDVPLSTAIAPWEIESQLATAPCGGPCKGTKGCENAPGWMGANRIKDPENHSGGLGGGVGEYNGMDYISTFNLYALITKGHYAVVPRTPPATCTAAQDPGAFIGRDDPTTASYDPRAACAELDMGRTYCGRSFASWLKAAYAGEVSIFTGSQRWVCAPGGACTFTPASGVGTTGADLYIGTRGSDSFDGGGGSDCIYGMGGDDHLRGGDGRDELHGGDGDDELCGGSCGGSESGDDADLVFGDAGDDHLDGGPGGDDLYGGAGHDALFGDDGDDALFGGDGDDVLRGGDGRDICEGEDGSDTLYGEAGADRLSGGPGRDKVSGGPGDDTLVGGPGDDFLMGDNGDDALWGEEGDDRLCGGCGGDHLNGGYSALDACRGTKISLVCTDRDSPNEQDPGSCGGAQLSNADCDDPAFDAW